MNEEEFDSFGAARPFGTGDAEKAEAQLLRCMKLGTALWGKNSEDLRRQLEMPHPQIPSGFDLTDFRKLQENVRLITGAVGDARFDFLPRSVLLSPTISVGAQSFTMWEAKCEVVRRAIQYLDRS